ncbi:MAG: hypothetical protein KatS3mg002_0279 [Candidatus Woesearchaeota archaeon]|nr:MAG: hypothetical protein KatS3mg002_0279 [Candidatus Woesearchaeota archaeon]
METVKIKSIAIVWGNIKKFIEEVTEHLNQERKDRKDKYINLGLSNIMSAIRNRNIPFEEKEIKIVTPTLENGDKEQIPPTFKEIEEEIKEVAPNIVLIRCVRNMYLPFLIHENILFKNGMVFVFSEDK